MALGFWGEAAYLGVWNEKSTSSQEHPRDPSLCQDTWNRLDFFIVFAGIAEYLLQEYLGNLNLTAIRTIRVLRPLRAVNRIPSMRILGLIQIELSFNPFSDSFSPFSSLRSEFAARHTANARQRPSALLLRLLHLWHHWCPALGRLVAQPMRHQSSRPSAIAQPRQERASGMGKCVVGYFAEWDILEQASVCRNSTTPFLPHSPHTPSTPSRFYIPADTSLDYICSQPDSSGLHTCQNLPPYKQNGQKCNMTLGEFQMAEWSRKRGRTAAAADDCVNWNQYYTECRVMHKNPFQVVYPLPLPLSCSILPSRVQSPSTTSVLPGLPFSW